MDKPLISVVTTVLNNREFIESAIQSVLNQTYPNIEYIIIDGGSTDGTVAIINKYKDRIAKFIYEKDRGIYDGLNKGLKLATGEIINSLNSDDVYADGSTIETVAKNMIDSNADIAWGDLVYVRRDDTSKIFRYWKSSEYQKGKFQKGWHPPHPTFFVRRKIYEQYGYFNLDFKIAADYELMLRFLEKYGVSSCYIPMVLVKMRVGGVSNRNIARRIQAHLEDYKAWRVNKLSISPLRILLKPLSKVGQYFKKE